tara:strand:+ start:212 stop:643 length:432 start_codon:yes stop_codon:yes gene_type:complete
MESINKDYFKKQHEEHNGISDERMEEIIKECNETQIEDNAITDKIDREETQKEMMRGIESFDADLVYDTLNAQATVFENIAEKFYQFEIDNISNETSSVYWNEAAKQNDEHAKSIRSLMTHLIRMQKGNDRIKNLRRKMGDDR